jgi:hypothetical protein
MSRACNKHGKKRNAYKMLMGKPEGKHLLERLKHRREDNITTDLGGTELGGMGWTDLAQDGDQWGDL